MGKSAKVVLIIVEGPSDETSLGDPIQSYCVDNNMKIKFKIQHGCNLTRYSVSQREYEYELSNVIGKLQKEFKSAIIKLKNSDKTKPSDYSNLLYCIDLDECFVNKSRDELKNKALVLRKLFNTKKLKIDKREIAFNVIFFSKDLESVLHDIDGSTLDNEKKEMLSNEFITKFNNNSNILKEIINNPRVKTWNTFMDGYQEIIEYNGTATNLNCLLDKIIIKIQ